ncbi:MAG TPA: DNA methyltransferase, partial [Pseudolysinimonas sp.]|nr:DNA methyltransferase [Pseudolysinimonas sp.]
MVHGDNLHVARALPDGSFRLIYLDPPFNTGKTQRLQRMTVTRADEGRVGFGGRRYAADRGEVSSYADTFDDYWAFLEPRLVEARRLLDDAGTLYLHLDYREAHYAKVALDRL